MTNKNHLLIYDQERYQRTIVLSDAVHPGRIPENIGLLPDKHNGLYISSIKGLWYLNAQGTLKDLAPVFNGNPTSLVSAIKTAFYDAADDRYYLSVYDRIFSYHTRYGLSTIVYGRYNHMAIVGERVWLANDNGISQWEKTFINGKNEA